MTGWGSSWGKSPPTVSKDTRPIIAWRLANGKTWNWIAAETGINRRTLNNVANGHPMSANTGLALERLTGIPVAELLRQGRE